MKNKIVYIFLFVLFGVFNMYGQNTIEGRIIDENLDILTSARIYVNDTIELDRTDFDGYFKINAPAGIKKLTFSWIGYESKTISLSADCDYLEVILFFDVVYDFMSSRKIDRLRKKRFDKLSEKHLKAHNKGLFKTAKPCYHQ